MKIDKNKIGTKLVVLCVAALGLIAPECTVALTNYFLQPSQPNNSAANELSEQLNWIVSNDPHNLCRGYFVEPILDASGQPIVPTNESITNISADSGVFSQKSTSILTGNVVVVQPGRRLLADHAVLYRDSSGKYKTMILTGNVRAYQPGQLLIADSGNFNLQTKTGVLQNVKYRTILAPDSQVQSHITPISNNQEKINATVAWGQANQAFQTQPKHTSYTEATYSTCAPNAVQWKMKASKMNLNKETEYGNVENARLYFKGIPIFYTPYWSFPLTNRRKTGFLFPLYGTTSVSGFQLGLPFYWNIAPNYDDTITPTYYSKRGVLFVNNFRYLTHHSIGSFSGSYMPDDKAFQSFQDTAPEKYAGQPGLNSLLNDSDDRYSFGWHDLTQFTPQWSGLVNYSRVSDDYYLQDFGTMPEQITTNQILQQGQIQYVNTHWTFTGLVEGFQTIHPVNRLFIPNAYNTLPQLTLDGNYPDFWKGLDFNWENQASYFTRSPSPGSVDVNTARFHTLPGLSYPLNWVWGYFTPSMQYDLTNYQLNYANVQSSQINGAPLPSVVGNPTNISRALPIFDIHSGIYLDRDLDIHNQGYDQTLEPELFYLFVPYDNQTQIPIFDSGIIPFDYSQLWDTNRFSGFDRVGDANQLSYAMTTRLINDQTGDEKFRFSLGQIYYFREHQVQLCDQPGGSSDCTDFLTGLGATPDDERVSPIAGSTSYHFNPLWSLNGGYAWDPTVDKSITGSAYFAYSPGFNELLNFGYDYLRNGNVVSSVPGNSENNLNQVSVSGAWPVDDRWSTLGIFNYNISQDHPQTYLAGLQYDTCCVDLRFLGGRVFSAINQVGNFEMQNAFYFQIQLKGLGVFGDNSLSSLLTSNIGGYVDPFQTNRFNLP